MTFFFHSDDVDHLIRFKEAVSVAENALKDLRNPKGTNAPRKRLHIHRDVGEGTYDTVLNVYAGGSASYGAIGAQVALHRKAIVGDVQKRPPYNPDQTELALIYDVDNGSLLGVMAHRPKHARGVADLRTPATSLAGLDLFARADATRVEASNYQLGGQFAAVAGYVIDRALEKGLGRELPAEWFSQRLPP